MNQIRLGLIGDNISEFWAPALHRLAASQLNIELSYDLMTPSHQGLDFEECLTHARHLGLSVSMSSSIQAAAFEQARLRITPHETKGAVNTLRLRFISLRNVR